MFVVVVAVFVAVLFVVVVAVTQTRVCLPVILFAVAELTSRLRS